MNLFIIFRVSSLTWCSIPSLSYCAFFLVLVDTMKELPITLLLRPFNFNTLATSLYEYSSDELFELGALHAFTIIISLSVAIYFFDSFLEKKIVLKDKK